MDPRWWRMEPMLAALGSPPADLRGWALEFKWDGLRALCLALADGHVELLSRSGQRLTSGFPDLADIGKPLSGREAVLDGEIVVLRAGQPDFAALQQRMNLTHPSTTRVRANPATYMAFDLLALDGEDLTGQPYRTRRELLATLTLTGPRLQVPPHYEDLSAAQLLRIADEHGLEGIVAKRLDASYRSGRSRSWIKIPIRRTLEALVGGWQPGGGSLAGTVGTLLLGAWTDDGRLAYLGHVASGLTRAQRATLADGLPELEIAECPFDPMPPPEHAHNARWVTPGLVVEVAYKELTRTGKLRAPSWRGVRTDLDPDNITLPKRPVPPA